MAVDGTWNVTMSTPMGDRPLTLKLAADGAALSGAVSGPQGDQPFSDGKVDGDNVSWSSTINGPMGEMTLTFAGAVSGDAIEGTVQFGSFGSGAFKGTRA
jgi:hypothetical protein